MYIASKLAEALITPSNLVGLILLLALVAMVLRLGRTATVLAATAAILFAVFAWSPVPRLALQILENRFQASELHAPVTGIIMIGGAVDVHLTYFRGQPSLNDAAERVTATMALMRAFPEARVILSGGGSQTTATGQRVTEAGVARDVLVSLGAEARRLELEEQSETTCENAIESYKLAQPKPDDRWVLITSASQMPRAVGCFRKAGFDIVAYPVDYRTKPDFGNVLALSAAADGLAIADLAAHEWFGLISYAQSGKIKDTFPGPIDHSTDATADSQQP